MSPLELIFILCVLQLVCYLLVDKYKINKWKLLVLGILMISYIFIIPGYFFPDNPNNEPRCGLPVLAITLAFWVMGCGAIIITHILYSLIRKIVTINKNLNAKDFTETKTTYNEND